MEPVCGPQHVDLSRAARRHPLVPSGIHFPTSFISSSTFVTGLQQPELFDLGLYGPPGHWHRSGAVQISVNQNKHPRMRADIARTWWILLVRGHLSNVIFPVSAARVLAITGVGFAALIIHTTPTDTTGLPLTQNTVLPGVVSVAHGHLVIPSGGDGSVQNQRKGVLMTRYHRVWRL